MVADNRSDTQDQGKGSLVWLCWGGACKSSYLGNTGVKILNRAGRAAARTSFEQTYGWHNALMTSLQNHTG